MTDKIVKGVRFSVIGMTVERAISNMVSYKM